MTDVDGRFTRSRFSRQTLALELKRAGRPALVVLIGLAVGVACLGWVLYQVSRTLLTTSHTIEFAVDDATAVVNGGADEVRYKGIPAGEIEKVKLVDGKQPVLVVKLQSKYGKIYRDAKAELRPNTALLDMYLNITDRGTPAAGVAKADQPIAASQTTTGVKVSDVLQVFRADTRSRLRYLLDGLGNGMKHRGMQLQEAFVELVPFISVAGGITSQLAHRAPQTARLVHDAGVLSTELGHRQTELRTLVRAGDATLTAIQSQSPSLDATLRELAPTLAAIDSSFTATRGVLGDVNTAVRSLYPVADRLPTSLQSLRDLSAAGKPAIDALQTPVRKLVPLSQSLVPASKGLSRAVTRLRPQVGTINHTTKDIEDCRVGLNGFFQWDASMGKYGDAGGPSPRGNVVAGLQSSGALNDPNEFAPQACTAGKPIGGRPARYEDGH